MPGDEAKPLFAVKPDGVIRQYINSKESQKKFYKDGTYSYDPSTGVLTLDGLDDMPAELRIIILTNEKMTGTCRDEMSADDILLESLEVIHTTSDGCLRENLRGFLEGSGRDE